MYYRLNDEKMFYDLADDQAIVIDSSSGIYYAMNVPGSLVFDSLARSLDPESVFRALAALPGCPPDMRGRLDDFIQKLLEYELIYQADPAVYPPGQDEPPFAPTQAWEDFLLEVDAFDDVKDIMLADPIHEVDLEEGWPTLQNKNSQDGQN